VARELDRLITERGKPKMVVSDDGTEPASNAHPDMGDQSRVVWHYIAPGKPMQNAIPGGSRRSKRVPATWIGLPIA
jgi:putative transposase